MRSLVLILFISGSTLSAGFGQIDTVKANRPVRSAQTHTPIPGVDAPLSAPGTLLQSPPNPNEAATIQQQQGKRRTAPPSDPRAFGVSVPLGKPKRDTLR
ncbi:hypothetical protein DYU11_01895 [Fibrisoma montanum]|uniref:Uncharacterized protein n=1 Tax=Fibrisoma montanum TaxID=2305895 RepID=A0A418MIA7_9BACT|nr:hypothetical protein [Fibrisoma montanum]RIV27093.1 hypothetical protein DYU11_01895 [Fibrisoma montanum]